MQSIVFCNEGKVDINNLYKIPAGKKNICPGIYMKNMYVISLVNILTYGLS